ncbi:MAG TPA: TonB-dependent receptor [Sphingobium sp.]|uniref:TonB-dependent receptor n=1 Tax=Sphingobium sp. TaxID=1912891 RepID=UPI002ED4505D
MSRKLNMAGISLAALMTALPQVAVAQQAPQEQEIVVTAQRRSERLIDVPASITAISAETLTKSGINNTADLAKAVPGIAMTFYGGFLQPAVRGITSTGANLGENSNVAMYVDGVYQPQQIATLIDLPDIQQVEVLKGPQGALYGQNATGGAILVTSMAPSFTPHGNFSASYGAYNDVSVRGYVTAPLSDTIAASLSGGYQNRDGFRRHVITNQRDKGLDSKVIRGKLLFQPSTEAKITLTGYYSDREDSATYAGFAINGNSIGYAPNLAGIGLPSIPIPASPQIRNPSQFATDPNVFTRIRSAGGNARGEFDVGAGIVTSVTSYSENKTNYRNDGDYSAVDIGTATANFLRSHYFIQDMNFASRKFGSVSFLVGGFYLNGAESFDNNNFDLLFPSVPPAPTTILFTASSQNARVDKEIIAGYGEATLQATDRIVLTAGGRYTREKQRAFSDRAIFTPGGTAVKVPNQVEYPGGAVVFSKFTPRITARYEITPRSNVYASWGQGFKSGIVNSTDFTIAPVKPETINAYEIGYKGVPIPGVRFNIAAFLYDYKNLQSVVYVPGSAYITQNAATARIKGVDFDVSWSVTPSFTLTGSGSFLDGKYRNFPGAVNYTPTGTGHVVSTIDLSGQRMLRSPKFSGNISANYEIDTGIGRFAAFGSIFHTASYGMEPTGRLRQNPYTTIDAEISLSPDALNGARFVLWGKNLTNKAYLASALIAGGFSDGGSYADPRTYGIRAEFRF